MAELDFYFEVDDLEFQTVLKLAETWTAQRGIDWISNGTMGDRLAAEFMHYVRTEHPDIAATVERDGTIYEGALMEWNDNQSK